MSTVTTRCGSRLFDSIIATIIITIINFINRNIASENIIIIINIIIICRAIITIIDVVVGDLQLVFQQNNADAEYDTKEQEHESVENGTRNSFQPIDRKKLHWRSAKIG